MGEGVQFGMIRRIVPATAQHCSGGVHPLMPIVNDSDLVLLNDEILGCLQEITIAESGPYPDVAVVGVGPTSDEPVLGNNRARHQGHLDLDQIGDRITHRSDPRAECAAVRSGVGASCRRRSIP